MRGASARVPTRRIGAAIAALLVLTAALAFLAPAIALTFPSLSGRIVDQAAIIPADKQAAIEPKLVDLETKSGIQLVVATVKSLEDGDIETYANGLFRTWKLGEKQKNNGVLLLVAPNERRVRIEVGYGLEGTLTDALSKVIIANAIAPRFKANDYGGGIERGVDDIITVLTTDSSEWEKRPDLRLDSQQTAADDFSPFGVALIIIVIILLIVSPGFRFIFFQIIANVLASGGSRGSGGSGWSNGGSSWSSGGGGFSGGGGSSGGGGASGSW